MGHPYFQPVHGRGPRSREGDDLRSNIAWREVYRRRFSGVGPPCPDDRQPCPMTSLRLVRLSRTPTGPLELPIHALSDVLVTRIAPIVDSAASSRAEPPGIGLGGTPDSKRGGPPRIRWGRHRRQTRPASSFVRPASSCRATRASHERSGRPRVRRSWPWPLRRDVHVGATRAP